MARRISFLPSLMSLPQVSSRYFKAAISKISGDRKGASTITLALMLPILIGFIALAVDVGIWQMNRRDLQGAVDQAAFSAAVASTNDATVTQAQTEGQGVMASMGFVHGLGGAAIIINNPPTQGSYIGNTDAWEVSATQTQNLLFGGLFLSGAPAVAARAVALKGTILGSGCILSLHTTAQYATSFTNNADVTDVSCDVYTNSNNAKALQCENNCDIWSNTFTVGGTYVTNNGTLHAATNATGTSPITNPYADITAPSSSSLTCTESNTVTGGANKTISPGVYCGGIDFGGNKTLTMSPGTYYIRSKFNLNNQATLNATNGVTIILLDGICIGDGTCLREKGIGNNVTINLEAPTTGTYAGIAIYAVGSSSTNKLQEFSNNTTLNIQGALYAPNDTFSFHNNAQFNNTICAQVVSKKVSFENNADMGTDCEGTGVKSIGGGTSAPTMVE